VLVTGGTRLLHEDDLLDAGCEFFQICGYQKQREQRPNVWI
jgi:hypothetical protein